MTANLQTEVSIFIQADALQRIHISFHFGVLCQMRHTHSSFLSVEVQVLPLEPRLSYHPQRRFCYAKASPVHAKDGGSAEIVLSFHFGFLESRGLEIEDRFCLSANLKTDLRRRVARIETDEADTVCQYIIDCADAGVLEQGSDDVYRAEDLRCLCQHVSFIRRFESVWRCLTF